MPMFGLGGHHPDSTGQSSSLVTEEGKRFDIALFSALDALDEGQASYAIIGGVAASGLGRPRSTQDIDIFVRPEDAEAILAILAKNGFRTEKVNPTWLFKAFKENVLIDIIFRSQGGIYFDDEMRNRAIWSNYHGRQVKLVSPEDFIIIKCAVHSEEGPHHWHDALSVLSQAKVDWDYLLHRSRKAPRRLLALLIYAQSNDILVPNQVIHQLYQTTFDLHGSAQLHLHPHQGVAKPLASGPAPGSAKTPDMKLPPQPIETDKTHAYLAERIREAIVASGRTGSMDIDVMVQGNRVLARGICPSQAHREWLIELIRHMSPGYEFADQLQVVDWEAPKDVEDLV